MASNSFSLDDETLSDLTLHYGDQSRRVHKVILYTKSGYFKTLFTSGFKESTADEIRLEEEDCEYFTCMLRYIYGEDVFVSHDIDMDLGAPNFHHAFRLFMLADKYQVLGLRDKLLAYVRKSDVGRDCGEDLAMTKVLNAAYETPLEISRDFRQALVRASQSLMPDLLSYEGAMNMLRDRPDVALDLLCLTGIE
ncbi:Hypothetical protein D9617_43g040090 [Elsinoe fawcettii]|nr:Hypothetical protein D9617_43g040090 [Elsinoe fawcettii]